MSTTTEPTPEQRALRVAIAKDIIVKLREGKLRATRGVYLWPQNEDARMVLTRAPNEQAESFPGECRACAVGSLFIAAFDRLRGMSNKALYQVTGGFTDATDRMFEYLEQTFEVEQLDIMEVAFESVIRHSARSMRRGTTEAQLDAFARAASFAAKVEVAYTDKYGADFFTDPDYTRTFDTEMRDRIVLEEIMKNVIEHDGEFVP